MKMIRALVVDDDSTNRMIHQKMLEKVGIVDKLEVASNGKEAVEIVAALGFDYFHLILMDMDMPVMNGIQVLNTVLLSMRLYSGGVFGLLGLVVH
ncbi:Two-component response regulator 24 [Linum perenne]